MYTTMADPRLACSIARMRINDQIRAAHDARIGREARTHDETTPQMAKCSSRRRWWPRSVQRSFG